MKSFTDKLIYKVPSKLPDKLIESIVEYLDTLPYIQSGVDGGQGGQVRSSKNAWINWDEWLPGIIYNMMMSANNEYFKYDLDYFHSKVQSTVYTADKRDHYNWHVDTSNSVIKSGSNKERKLSCYLIISGPNEYEGGELEFQYDNIFHKSYKPERGECIIFPSWLPHKVNPVTSGKRISLVAWIQGPLFK